MTFAAVLETLIKIGVVFFVALTAVAYLTLAERKISGWIQDRIGPNRVGPWGLLQPLADGIKFMMKEEVVPSYAHRPIYMAAPALLLISALSALAIIPFGDRLTLGGYEVRLAIADVNIGILFFLAMSSVGVYGIVLAGWSSNNKYAMLGGLRASAQMISYELGLALSLIGVLMVSGSLRLSQIVEQQGSFSSWNVWSQPLGFLIFMVSAFAETNRLPFDLAEAETELVAGYHTEYSAIKFSMFYMAEYVNMITASALMATLFFGGWQLPFPAEAAGVEGNHLALLQILCFLIKTGFFLFVFIWVRWTLPRFRYDQLMHLGWKVLLPLALLNLIWVGIGVAWGWF
ncbi:MAG: NADH-quinone oxidoreductase subunit NuoH [Acidobacteriota bacterium]